MKIQEIDLQEFINGSLPKWPGLLITGEKVTKEQAMEIILRTSHMPFSSNDREFEKELYHILYDVDADSWNDLYDKISIKYNLKNKLEVFDIIDNLNSELDLIKGLNYLCNNQIVSCWIGGPHGWCDWDGNIYTANHNIGKYPSCEEVYNELKIIAKEFPFLKFKCQLLNTEICEIIDEPSKPVITFDVSEGKVLPIKVEHLITEPKDLTEEYFKKRFLSNTGERGCTIEQFQEAYNYLKNKFKK